MYFSVDSSLTTEQTILTYCFLIFALQQIYMLYIFNIKSQKIVDKHKTLLEALDSNQDMIYMVKVEDTCLKKLTTKLEKFPGFTALNYFTLNKSLLTSIVANFLTYIIVLLQFNPGDSSDNSNANASTMS